MIKKEMFFFFEMFFDLLKNKLKVLLRIFFGFLKNGV